MGIRIPKIKTDGTVFDSQEQFHPSEFIYFHCDGEHAELFKVVLDCKHLHPIQELEKQALDQGDEGAVLADAIENLASILDNGLLLGSVQEFVAVIDPIWRLKERLPPRVYCTDPMNLVEVIKVTGKHNLLETLLTAVRPWGDFWEAKNAR